MAQLPWLSFNGAGAGFGAGVTRYGLVGQSRTEAAVSGVEANVHLTLKNPGTLSLMWVRISANTTSATSTMTSRKNSGAGAMSISIGSGTTGEFADTTNSDALAAGDEPAWQMVVGAGGSLTMGAARFVFAATTDSMLWHVSQLGPDQTLNGVSQFYPLNGFHGSGSTTEANWQHTIEHAATFSGLGCNVRTNAKGGNSFLRLRKNGGNGNSVVTIGAGVTGLLQDVTNTDSVSAGDLLNYAVDFFADGNALRFWTLGVESVSATSQGSFLSAQGDLPAAVVLSTTTYVGVGQVSYNTTELDLRQDIPLAGTIDKGNVYIVANSLTGNTTFRLRKNGADAAVLMTVGSGVTGWAADGSNSESFAANDEVSWQIATPGAGTSIQFNNLSARWTTPTAAGGRIFKLAGDGGGLAGPSRGLAA